MSWFHRLLQDRLLIALALLLPPLLATADLSAAIVLALTDWQTLMALAVNAGSTLSPVGNPQNLYLWQHSGVSFIDFTSAMLPLASGLIAVAIH